MFDPYKQTENKFYTDTITDIGQFQTNAKHNREWTLKSINAGLFKHFRDCYFCTLRKINRFICLTGQEKQRA